MPGVHALGQVAHFDLIRDWPTDTVRAALNFHLKPDPDRGRRLRPASPTTSTRASARWRGTTAIASWRGRRRRRSTATACGGCRSRSTPRPCARRRSALVGRHDFTTFRAAGCQAKSPLKTLDRLDVSRRRRRDRHRGLGALVPAQPGALDGRLAEAGRRGQVDGRTICARRSRPRTAPPAAPWRRRAASTSCVWIIQLPTRSPRAADIATGAPASHKGAARTWWNR